MTPDDTLPITEQAQLKEAIEQLCDDLSTDFNLSPTAHHTLLRATRISLAQTNRSLRDQYPTEWVWHEDQLWLRLKAPKTAHLNLYQCVHNILTQQPRLKQELDRNNTINSLSILQPELSIAALMLLISQDPTMPQTPREAEQFIINTIMNLQQNGSIKS